MPMKQLMITWNPALGLALPNPTMQLIPFLNGRQVLLPMPISRKS